MVLEWQYADQDFGPGINEQFSPEELLALANLAGFSAVETIPLHELVLYRLTYGKKVDPSSCNQPH